MNWRRGLGLDDEAPILLIGQIESISVSFLSLQTRGVNVEGSVTRAT